MSSSSPPMHRFGTSHLGFASTFSLRCTLGMALNSYVSMSPAAFGRLSLFHLATLALLLSRLVERIYLSLSSTPSHTVQAPVAVTVLPGVSPASHLSKPTLASPAARWPQPRQPPHLQRTRGR